MQLHYFWFLLFWCKYSLSLFSLHNNNNNNNSTNSNNNNHNNNNNNSSKNSIIPYIIIGSYLFLCTFALNVIANTHLSKGSINLAALAVP